jgi:hypothetical protein
MIHDPERVEIIRQRVERSLQAISVIENKATGGDFRALLRHPRNQLTDIEILIANLAWQSRSSAEEADYLSNLEIFLAVAETACQLWNDAFGEALAIAEMSRIQQ